MVMRIISDISELFKDDVPTTQVTRRVRRFKGDMNVSEIPGEENSTLLQNGSDMCLERLGKATKTMASEE
jgi:hypothetical protein